jgi:hypothetical protein
VNVADVADLVKNDLRIASRMIVKSSNIPTTVVFQILKEDFCARYFFLLHDNAPAHKAESVCQFLTQKCNNLLSLPVLSRFISAKYFLFLKLKIKFKGLQFADVAEIQETATDEVKKFQTEEFSAAFQKLYDRAKA